jgi:tyrosine-protein phosphatase SIW14
MRIRIFLAGALVALNTCPFLKAQPLESRLRPLPSACRQTDQEEPGMDQRAAAIPATAIPDFAQVTPTLYRGGQPRRQAFELLAKLGIQIVVDLRGDRDAEREEVARLGMEYVPMHWQCSFPKDHIFADFIELIRKNPGKKIFIHCRVGDDRTGMMIAAYRMAEEGWSAERAREEMEKYGFSFVHRRLICPRLASYEASFPKRLATEPEFEELRQAKRPERAQEAPEAGMRPEVPKLNQPQ